MYLAYPLPEGEVDHRRDPNTDRWRCAACGYLSKRARKEKDQLCLKCHDEAVAS